MCSQTCALQVRRRSDNMKYVTRTDPKKLLPGQVEMKQIHRRAHDVVKPHFDAENAKRLRAYRNTLSPGRTSDDIRQSAPAVDLR